MYSVLIAVIYLAFISLGLPDSLLGSAWPVMQPSLGVPVSYAGIITMIISFGTIVSSLLSDRLTLRMGAGGVTGVSVLLTAVALLGFSFSDSFVLLCLLAVPYGLGAGAVDAALNNYVALHYSSRHMSWLHCFWGVGASISPYIMGYCLTGGLGWKMGYRSVGIIQIVITAILLISLPLWKKRTVEKNADSGKNVKPLKIKDALKIKGVVTVLIAFFAYCAVEQTAGLWASSYLADYRDIDPIVAAEFASLFYLGITFGRFICGFAANKLGDKLLIRIGCAISAFGVILIMIPLDFNILPLSGLMILGLGCAPIYPSIIHSTPANFGEQNSQAIIGIQMASAYLGTTLMPPLFGVIASWFSLGLYPVFLIFFVTLMFIMSQRLSRKINP